MGWIAGKTLYQVEIEAIVEALKHYGGNRAAAARALGIAERTMANRVKRMKEEGLDVPPPAAPVPPKRASAHSSLEQDEKPCVAHRWTVHHQPSTPDGPGESIEYCDECGAERTED